MSLSTARAHAFDLANTLMQTVLLVQGDDGYGVMVADDYDGEEGRIVNTFDPYDPAH